MISHVKIVHTSDLYKHLCFTHVHVCTRIHTHLHMSYTLCTYIYIWYYLHMYSTIYEHVSVYACAHSCTIKNINLLLFLYVPCSYFSTCMLYILLLVHLHMYLLPVCNACIFICITTDYKRPWYIDLSTNVNAGVAYA